MKPYTPGETPTAPPRFIPTLTEVVEFDENGALQVAEPLEAIDAAAAPSQPDPAPEANAAQPALPSEKSSQSGTEAAGHFAPNGAGAEAPLPIAEPADHSATEGPAGSTTVEAANAAAIEAQSSPAAEQEEPPAQLAEANPASLPITAAEPPLHLPAAFTDDLVHTIMQKVDFVLAERIKEAVSLVIEQQTRALIPLLREELEFTVRKTIDEATSDALLEMLDPEPS